MPFVNIQILKGHPQERKDEIARRVTAAISELAQLPPEAIWVVFEDVAGDDWYVGPTRVERAEEAGGRQMSVEIRDPQFRSVVGDAVEVEKIATGFLFTEGPLWHAQDQYLLFSDMPGDHLRKWSALERRRRPSASRARNRTAWPGTGRAG